jgi:methylenetetrahydrofolate dehydrogenase (NADP+)/methenyltetrahydrofolate cyclohydrolase
MANLLMGSGLAGDATVTVCHRYTSDLAYHTRQADILVVAVGKPDLITADMVKPGAVVVDVGMNRVADPASPKGYRLVGDVSYDAVAQIASAITPVPGGVGPMTIAMLLKNTLQAAKQADARAGGQAD